MPSSSPILFERARVGSLTRDRKPDDPELIEARSNLRVLVLERHVRKALAEGLTPEQAARIAELLAGGDN
jgi:hypothetical protein